MKRKMIWVVMAWMALGMGALAQEPADFSVLNFAPQTVNPAPQASREDELYQDGSDYLDEGKYQEALQKFTAAADLKGKRADGALYWKAYSHNKLGHRNEALATIAELRRQYPQSRWLKDAGALEIEIRQGQGQPVKPGDTSDEELKLLAIQSLMNSDQERAVPLLENILRSNNSPRVKDRALFVLAQSDSPRAQQAIASVAKGQQYPELQRKAIQYLGVNDTAQNKRSLVEIYNTSTNAEIKRTVIHAFLTCDAKEELVSVARNERDSSLRREAIHTLGAMEARNELHQMYQSSLSVDDKKSVIQALGVSEDVPFLGQIAKNPAGEVEVRRDAIHALGVAGEKARPLLMEVYNSDRNSEIREAALDGLFVNDADDELIALARKETDPQMKRRIVEKLSVMDSKKAHEYMMEILNK